MSLPRIRVMQLTEDLGVGGLETVVATLTRTIDKSQFDCSVLCLKDEGALADELRADGFVVHRLETPPPGKADYFAFRKVARLLRERRIDVIHTHNTSPLVDGALGAMLSGVRTVVHTDHARDFPDKLRYVVAEHLLSHYVYRMVGVSDQTTRNLRRYERIPLRKLKTIPNGISGARYRVATDPAAKRRELGLRESGPVIGLAARLTEQKGVRYLLDAMPALVARFPDLTLVIAGIGVLEPELRAQAAASGVADHVRFVGVRRDMPELLQLFDVFCVPSIWEGLPMSVLESLAAGCPLVASAVGGVPSAIEHGVSGLLLPPRDPAALADAISTLLRDPALARRYAAAGRRVFDERFSAEAMTRQYERLYLRQDG